MAYEISYVDNADTVLAHCKMVDRIKTLALANGWSTLRDVSTSNTREIILLGVGLTGLENIYIGFKTYLDVGADYYNIQVGTFTGYTAGNSFETQPGFYLVGVPAHNARIDYWLCVNAQRIACTMKVGTPVYESFYAGKFVPYARPTQYPYPVFVGGSFAGAAATRFSDTAHYFYVRGGLGTRAALRNNSAWVSPYTYPYDSNLVVTTQIRDTNNEYQLFPVELFTATDLYGRLDGIYHITGFNNATENTLVISGITYVVIQDTWRTGHGDYYALRIE
jgi:hypothetical protein